MNLLNNSTYKFYNDKRVIELRKFNGIYACVMLSFFLMMPMLAATCPEKYYLLFKTMTYIEIISLIILGLFQIISYASFDSEEYSLGDRIIYMLNQLGKSIINNKTGLILIIVYIICFISALFAPDKTRAFYGNGIRPDGMILYSCLFVVFIYSCMTKNSKHRKIVFCVTLVSFVVSSLIMLQQYYGIIGSAGIRKPGLFGRYLMGIYDNMGIRTGHFWAGLTGPFYNLNHMGYFVAVNTMLISGALIISKKTWSIVLWSIFAMYSYYILIINNTFGCYLAVLAVLVLISPVICIKTVKCTVFTVLKSLLPLIILLLISLLVMFSPKEENVISQNFNTLKKDVKTVATSDNLKKEKSGSGRMTLWISTIDMIKEKPLLGYGPDNLNDEYTSRGHNITRAHNEPLEIAVATGIPSAVLYYVAIIYAIYSFIKKKYIFEDGNDSSCNLISFMALCTYLVSSLFGVFLFYTVPYCIIALGFLSSSAFEKKNEVDIFTNRSNNIEHCTKKK